jgi:hypothetical protein
MACHHDWYINTGCDSERDVWSSHRFLAAFRFRAFGCAFRLPGTSAGGSGVRNKALTVVSKSYYQQVRRIEEIGAPQEAK